MPLLLDAYNILHVVGVLPPDLAGIDLEELADLIAGSRFRQEPAILVCDGPPRRHGVAAASVHVRFAGPGRTADDLIVRLVGRSTAPRRVTVVTSDREIAQAVRRRRAAVIESDRFLEMLAEDHRTPRSGPETRGRSQPRHLVDRRQVEAWLRVFDLDPEIQAIAPSSPPAADPRSETSPPSTPSKPSASPPKPTPPQPPATNRRRRAGGRPAIEAERLAEIDPATVDDLDTGSLLDGDPNPTPDAERVDDGRDPS